MRVTSIVLHFGSLDDTVDAVRSLLVSNVSSDLIVVNNEVSGSVDVERLRDANHAVQVIEAGTNRGFAAGVNLGLRKALGQGVDAVFLLNNDAFVEPNALAGLLAAAEADPSFGILAPEIYYATRPARIWSAGWRRRRWLRLLSPASPTTSGERIAEAPVVAGCAMLIRSSVLERVGLFDERFFLYYEDVDLCQRARAGGFRVGVVPGSSAYHKVSERPRLLELSRVYPWARSKALCYGRTPGVVGSLTASFRLAVGTLAFMARCALSGNLESVPLYLKGTRDGWLVARSS